MKRFILIFTALIPFFTGCTEDVDLTVVGGEFKIVVEGRIENGKVAEVFVMRSNPLSSKRDYSEFYFVDDAVITLSDGTVTETLIPTYNKNNPVASKPRSESAYYLPYISKTIKGVVGKTYTLTVKAAPNPDKLTEVKTYTATTTIPVPKDLDKVWWQAQKPYDTLGLAWARLTEPAGTGNNYKWYAKRSNKWYQQGEYKDRRYLAPTGSTFDDKFIDGKSFDFSFNRALDPSDSLSYSSPSEQMTYFKNTDTIYIKFCTIDDAATKFYTTYEAAYQTNGNPFASPVTILSNISEGGLGIWAGFGCTYDTIIPK